MSEIANVEPMEISIGGKKFKARKLNIGELLGHFGNLVKQEKLDLVYKMAETLPSEERVEFLSNAIENQPMGQELDILAGKRAECFEGYMDILYIATKDLNDGIDNPKYFNDIIDVNNNSELDPIVGLLTGIGEVKKNMKKKPKEK